MNLDKILKTGNEVRIKGESDSFITTIDEVTSGNTFTILGPYRLGRQPNARPDENFSVSCVTERGLYMFEAVVLEIDDTTSISIIHLRVNSDIRRVQRRQAFRVRETVTVNARRKSGDMNPDGKWVKTNTIDIAELGMLLKFDENCQPGQELEMTLRINLFGINEVIPKIRGRVVRCIQTRNKEFGFLLGIQFEDIPEKARDALIKLVVLSQRNKLTYKNPKKLR
jgi:c-di-GMP-binding flagellar brake protein YcgR